MLRILLLTFFIFRLPSASAQSFDKTDSMAITRIVDEWNRAWKVKDPVLASRGYSEDSRFTNAFGDTCRGREEVEALLRHVFSLPFVTAGSSEIARQELQVISPGTVIVHTVVQRKGQQVPDGKQLGDRKTTHLRVMEKRNGTWHVVSHLISDARDKQSPKH